MSSTAWGVDGRHDSRLVQVAGVPTLNIADLPGAYGPPDIRSQEAIWAMVRRSRAGAARAGPTAEMPPCPDHRAQKGIFRSLWRPKIRPTVSSIKSNT